MNRSPEKVLSYLAGYENIDAVTVTDLQKLAAENPYFAISQFLLAKKLKQENEPEYASQVQKAALYFSNHYWLQYQLSEGAIPEELEGLKSGAITATKKLEEKISDTAPSAEDTHPITTFFSTTELVEASNLAHDMLQETEEPEGVEVNDKVENVDSTGVTEPTQEERTARPEIIQAEEEMAATARNTNEEAETFISHLDPPTPAPGITNETLSENLSPAAELEVTELEEEMAGVSHNSDKTTEHFLDDVSGVINNTELPQDDEHDRMFQNIKAMLDASSEEADADTKNAVIHIDPYYTIDYFASQGIKLDLDQNPQDQLGQNLKKFTHWLRHMKKLGPEDATEVINRTESEADIQQIADSSNTVREVVTEAMASVLEKQGKKDKAIELYNKLSFLNPDKNAYFADKIKKLKGF